MKVARTDCVVVSAKRMRCARGVACAAAALWAETMTLREKVLTASMPEARMVRIGITVSGWNRSRRSFGMKSSIYIAATAATTDKSAIKATRTQSLRETRSRIIMVCEAVLKWAIGPPFEDSMGQ